MSTSSGASSRADASSPKAPPAATAMSCAQSPTSSTFRAGFGGVSGDPVERERPSESGLVDDASRAPVKHGTALLVVVEPRGGVLTHHGESLGEYGSSGRARGERDDAASSMRLRPCPVEGMQCGGHALPRPALRAVCLGGAAGGR